jgi:hypothetical protein
MERSRKNAVDAKRELLPGQSAALLKELHLMTRDGVLNADALRKLKQVNHLVDQLRPALDDLAKRTTDVHIVDVGSGKSYLGFVLYELFAQHHERVHIHNVEMREDLVRDGTARAARLGYTRMHFVHATAMAAFDATATLLPRVHLVLALHACDTATDDALWWALSRGADHIAVVPCCQAELSRLLPATSPLSVLWQHAHHKREFASHTTNVMRALVLQAMGHQVRVTELVGFEHSFKNELIVGRRVHRFHAESEAQLRKLSHDVGAKPQLVRDWLQRSDALQATPSVDRPS